MKTHVITTKFISYDYTAHKTTVLARIACDTVSQLVDFTGVGDTVFSVGSIAHAVDDAEILALDSSGSWVVQAGDNKGIKAEDYPSENEATENAAEGNTESV